MYCLSGLFQLGMQQFVPPMPSGPEVKKSKKLICRQQNKATFLLCMCTVVSTFSQPTVNLVPRLFPSFVGIPMKKGKALGTRLYILYVFVAIRI